jgi:hypothetical protein
MTIRLRVLSARVLTKLHTVGRIYFILAQYIQWHLGAPNLLK